MNSYVLLFRPVQELRHSAELRDQEMLRHTWSLMIPGRSFAFMYVSPCSLAMRCWPTGFPSKLLLAEIRRAYLSERKEQHTLLMLLYIFICLLTGDLYSCLHAAESSASKQVRSDGLCALQQDTIPNASFSIQISEGSC